MLPVIIFSPKAVGSDSQALANDLRTALPLFISTRIEDAIGAHDPGMPRMRHLGIVLKPWGLSPDSDDAASAALDELHAGLGLWTNVECMRRTDSIPPVNLNLQGTTVLSPATGNVSIETGSQGPTCTIDVRLTGAGPFASVSKRVLAPLPYTGALRLDDRKELDEVLDTLLASVGWYLVTVDEIHVAGYVFRAAHRHGSLSDLRCLAPVVDSLFSIVAEQRKDEQATIGLLMLAVADALIALAADTGSDKVQRAIRDALTIDRGDPLGPGVAVALARRLDEGRTGGGPTIRSCILPPEVPDTTLWVFGNAANCLDAVTIPIQRWGFKCIEQWNDSIRELFAATCRLLIRWPVQEKRLAQLLSLITAFAAMNRSGGRLTYGSPAEGHAVPDFDPPMVEWSQARVWHHPFKATAISALFESADARVLYTLVHLPGGQCARLQARMVDQGSAGATSAALRPKPPLKPQQP